VYTARTRPSSGMEEGEDPKRVRGGGLVWVQEELYEVGHATSLIEHAHVNA